MHPLQSKLSAINQLIALTTTLYDTEVEKGQSADGALISELDKQLQKMDHERDECLTEMRALGVPVSN